jgi:hypothetical protein
LKSSFKNQALNHAIIASDTRTPYYTDTLYETSSGYGKIKVGPTTLARHTQGV